MSEERALEAFPLDTYGPGDMFREVFIRGYERAQKDMIEKAMKWVKTRTHMFKTMEEVDIYIDLFRKMMEDDEK